MAEYPPPIDPTEIFNKDNWIPSPDAIDLAFLQASFCEFPVAQGLMNFSDVNVSADVTISQNLLLAGTPNLNYLEFPDGTKQYTAPSADDINTVYNDVSNTFISPFIQTFQGSNLTTSTTAPLQFSNVTTGEYGSLFVDPNPNNDLTIYSNQAGGGLTVSNSTNSFTINPTTTNTASFLNPIVSNDSITGQSLGINTTGGEAYTIDSRAGFGLTVVNTVGNAELSLSNGGANVASITCTSGNLLDFNGASIALNGIGCQAISCTTLNTNANTITSGDINAGDIVGSSLNTTGNITTASNGLGGTSVFNDTQCNFNAISCGGNVEAGSLTLKNGASTSTLSTSIAGLNVDTALTAGNITTSSVFSSTGGINMGGNGKFASGSNSGGTPILSANQGLYITRNITNGLAEFDIVAMNNTTSTGINIYSSQNADVDSTTVPEISISNTRTTINADLYVNPANTLYVNTIIPANTGPIQMAGGTFLATNPAPTSNDTTIATTSFVNTAISSIPSGAVIQSGQINGCSISGSMGSAIGTYLQNDYIGVSTYTVNLSALGLQTYASNTSYVATACFSNINFSIANSFMQMLYGMWITVNTTSGSTFVITVYAPLHVNNPANTVNGTPTFNLIWTTSPRLSTQ